MKSTLFFHSMQSTLSFHFSYPPFQTPATFLYFLYYILNFFSGLSTFPSISPLFSLFSLYFSSFVDYPFPPFFSPLFLTHFLYLLLTRNCSAYDLFPSSLFAFAPFLFPHPSPFANDRYIFSISSIPIQFLHHPFGFTAVFSPFSLANGNSSPLCFLPTLSFFTHFDKKSVCSIIFPKVVFSLSFSISSDSFQVSN